MMKQITLISLLTMTVMSCQVNVAEKLKGTWENTFLTVTMKLDNGQDSVMVINEGEWETILKIKPIVTNYKADGTFTSKYFGIDGQPVGTEKGTWKVQNDSLILNSAGYDNAYKVVFEGDLAQFVSYIDRDQDSKADDLYDGWQKKLKDE